MRYSSSMEQEPPGKRGSKKFSSFAACNLGSQAGGRRGKGERGAVTVERQSASGVSPLGIHSDYYYSSFA